MTNISLIITCYNSSLTIEIVIKQILKFIKDNDEIVVVDDGSTDNTTKKIQNISDKRINLICAKRIGRPKALNLAINNSKGKYLFINDADDIPSKLRFEDSIRNFKKGYDAVFGQELPFYNIDKSKIDKINFDMEKIENTTNENLNTMSINSIFRTNSLTHSTLAIKKDKLLKIGFYDENIDLSQDLDLYFRFVVNKLKVCISKKVYTTRNIGNSYFTSNFANSNYSLKKYYEELFKIRKKYRNILKPPIFTYVYDLKIFLSYIFTFLK